MIFDMFRKKLPKGVPGRESCSGRLLWNSNGHWKDKWFTYEDGILSGYKVQGVRPPDLTIDMKTARLTIYGADEFMRKLNLFKVTNEFNVSHMFAAWTEEQYESWVEILGYAVGKNIEQASFNQPHNCSLEEETFDNDIIPYERAVEQDQKRVRDKSKRLNDSRVESIDSGNDGDESGLESSVSSLSLFETRKRTEMERKQFGLGSSHHSSIQEINEKGAPLSTNPPMKQIGRSFSEKDLLQTLKDSNRSPHFMASEHPLDIRSYPKRGDIYLKSLERQRPTSLLVNRPSELRSVSEMKRFGGSFKANTPKGTTMDEIGITITPFSEPSGIPPSQSTPQDYNMSSSQHSRQSSQTIHSRQSSTDTYLHLNDVALDSSSSAQTLDTRDGISVKRYSADSFCSDDNNNEYHRIPLANHVAPIAPVNLNGKLENVLREETLLRKRRNSLNLEREDMRERIDELKGTTKTTKQLKQVTQIGELAMKLDHIDKEIQSIDRKISVPPPPTNAQNTKKRKASSQKRNSSNFITKMRNAKPKDMHLMAHAVSVESLTSSASHDSSIGRESPFSSQTIDTERNSYTPIAKPVSIVERPCFNKSTSLENSPVEAGDGFAQLLRTTKRLENGDFVTTMKKENKNEQDKSLSSRSKSMTAVDKIPKRTDTFTGKSPDFIIDDFEKFSARLMKKQLQTSITIEI